ncbi:MAG TPA: hypothetical protein DCQ06_06720 [Myxococcales bacterium]|nr:hypothetical protein [Myxococcales bacterium]HAN31276.1 hypothetical protein [Myxococcales bacterium]
MARPRGSRNRDYAQRRADLALRASEAMIRQDGSPSTLSDLAHAAGVSVPTLRHYFDDRDGVIAAALAKRAEYHLMTPKADLDTEDVSVSDSLTAFLHGFINLWRELGVGQEFSVALQLAMRNPILGEAAVDHVFEPVLDAAQRRLTLHHDRGELCKGMNLRIAAFSLLSPLIVGLLHQDQLSGDRCRPFDVWTMAQEHVDRFVRGYGTE